MSLTLSNARLVTPVGVVEGSLTIDGDHIAAIGAETGGLDLDGGYLLPGFIDTQVNGGGGVLFNDTPTAEAVAAIGAAHRTYGTTGFFTTLISDDLSVVDKALRATEAAIAQGVPGVLGIHIEGPFLNVKRKGTHDESKFRRLDAEAVRLLSSLKSGKVLLTLAPELAAPEDIRALAEAGVIIAAGHTDATYAEARRGFGAGITGVTHLYNAMSPLSHRAPGVVGAVLESDDIYAGIIVDGAHVDPVALKIALKSRPHDRFMLVTDAMPTVGSATKHFNLMGKDIRVENGVCVGPDGTLAGSDLDMATAVRNSVQMLDLPLETASMMASEAPARFMKLPKTYGHLAVGARADLVWLDADLQVRGVWIGGRSDEALRKAA
ncbi:N-acetylglucosamine-6-phosphate deacetylase [Asticcacaulis sp. DW145]|uniref:N-acetylglucosamine-6-phosphate deacetylase n=1 Tax=Asticcacaulis currens TaxID=2984210 RepID=A0ABT5IEJ8_9CAUL|nr:N-acetylglucosamine-6-phosphate deacetylase [Asticcacaulis currens]BEV11045.1 N-acetylglucosamine-6-phosphate deacetylase [Asticcacaulis sp. DW145]